MATHPESHFLCLPPEIIETIFQDAGLNGKELCSLTRTCTAFRDVLLRNEFWRVKFFQKWPELQSVFPALLTEANVCWKSLYRDRTMLKPDVLSKLKDFSQKTHHGEDRALLIMEEGSFFNFDTLSIFSLEDSELLSHEQKMMLITSELLEIYHGGDKCQNLNAKFFAKKSLFYLCHQLLEPEIKAYASQEKEERDIEEGAFLLAKWFQPTCSFTLEDIKENLDKLAGSIKTALKEINPKHPIFDKTLEMPQPSELRESLWGIHDCRLIISAMEQTLKPLLQKDFNLEQYYAPENSFINLVLKCYKGIPITLSLVVLCIAYRLGMVLEPVNFPRHFILRWKEYPMRSGMDQFSFIDVFNGNYSLTYNDLVQNFSGPDISISAQNCVSCSTDDILQRMLRNLVAIGRQNDHGADMMLLHHACQLYILFYPQDLHMSMLEIQIQLQLEINLPQAFCMIEELASAIPWMHAILGQLHSRCQHIIQQVKHSKTTFEIKRRGDFKEVTFSVGMVMRHKKYNYLCVIYGWDDMCRASREWIRQMGVNGSQEREPFYNVLVMDGTYRYACQENLQFTPDICEITHPMVGLYFDSFNGQHYIPCESMQELYPDDANITHTAVTKFFNSQ